MLFGKTKLEFKVGVFVFFAAVILSVFVLSIGGIKTWTAGYRVNLIFNYVNGVKLGAPVRFAGVDVGTVKKVKFYYSQQEEKTKIKLNCWVRREVMIPIDSTIWVDTLGLLGEKYIEIMPGKDYSRCLKENEDIIGEDPIPMHDVTKLARKIADELSDAIVKIKNKEGTIGKLLYDDTLYNDLEAMVKDLRNNPWKLLFRPRGAK